MCESVCFHLVKNCMEFHGKCHRNSSTAAMSIIALHVVFVGIVSVVMVVVYNEVAVILLSSFTGLLWLPPALRTRLLLVPIVTDAGYVEHVTGVRCNGLLGRSSSIRGRSSVEVAEEALGQHGGRVGDHLRLKRNGRRSTAGGIGYTHCIRDELEQT